MNWDLGQLSRLKDKSGLSSTTSTTLLCRNNQELNAWCLVNKLQSIWSDAAQFEANCSRPGGQNNDKTITECTSYIPFDNSYVRIHIYTTAINLRIPRTMFLLSGFPLTAVFVEGPSERRWRRNAFELDSWIAFLVSREALMIWCSSGNHDLIQLGVEQWL